MSRRATRAASRPAAGVVPERTCFRCDGVFRVASDDRRVYCPACRNAYGFPAPTLADFRPGSQLPLFPVVRPADRQEARSA